jgi:CMP-N-acetylneuraminic acid synthetase
MKSRKGPYQPFGRETGRYHRVLIYVNVIIEIYELMADDLSVNRKSSDDQTSADQQLATAYSQAGWVYAQTWNPWFVLETSRVVFSVACLFLHCPSSNEGLQSITC